MNPVMPEINIPKPLTSSQTTSFCGSVILPGDKSISHRALILGALAIGKTRISGLLEGEDVLHTARAMEMLGANVERHGDGEWSVQGIGTGGFKEPSDVINCGNSGTGVRLLMGAIATTPIMAVFTGDASLRSRPMFRVTKPLSEFGAQFITRSDGLLPITATGATNPVPIKHQLSVKSAQVKSAVLLAGLNAPGQTEVTESGDTRDHTERMLKSFGANINIERQDSESKIILDGYSDLAAQSISIPSDPSSAAFPLAAALMIENSDIRITGVGINPTRIGFFDTVQEMGAPITISAHQEAAGEPMADIHVTHSPLQGVEVPPERATRMIDEYPILAALAAYADGDTVMRGIGELRLKESDRIHAMVQGLNRCGVETSEAEDQLTIHGRGAASVAGGVMCQTYMDHRIAMSFLCLGLASHAPISIDDAAPIETSFPNFVSIMNGLGANFRPASGV